MRKNLHYKVLASVLAIAGLYFYNAPAAWAADIQNVTGYMPETWIGEGTINKNIIDGIEDKVSDNAEVYGWYGKWSDYGDSSKKSNNNVITIKNSTLSKVTGGHTEGELKNDDAKNNTVNIENSSITYLVGGYSIGGTVSGNKVSITGNNNSFQTVSGGTTGEATATGNTVTINGNVEASGFIAGGVGETGYSKIYGNQVIIQSGTVTGKIYGGCAYINTDKTTEVYDNNITIENKAAKNIGADLYGGYAYSNQATIRDNTLTLNGWSGSIKSVQNFSDIDFKEVDWQNGGTVLTITGSPEKALANTKLNLISFAGGTTINKDESMTFVASENNVALGITEANLNVDSGFFAGVTVYGDGQFAVDDKGNITYTVQEVKTNKPISKSTLSPKTAPLRQRLSTRARI